MVVIGAGGVGGAENINNWLIIVKQFSLFEFREKIMIAFNSKNIFLEMQWSIFFLNLTLILFIVSKTLLCYLFCFNFFFEQTVFDIYMTYLRVSSDTIDSVRQQSTDGANYEPQKLPHSESTHSVKREQQILL